MAAWTSASLLAWTLLVQLAGGIVIERASKAYDASAFIHINPPDFNDYTRGRTPVKMFPDGQVPNQDNVYDQLIAPTLTQSERFVMHDAGWTVGGKLQKDPVLAQCDVKPLRPQANFGHVFYDVRESEFIPFLVPVNQSNKNDMAVIVAPAGGNTYHEWEPSGVGVAEWLNSIGISAFVLKYRVPDFDFAAQLSDAQRAISLVKSLYWMWGVNYTKIGFMGSGSAGGLALKLGTAEKRNYEWIDNIDDLPFKPDFIISNYPVKTGAINAAQAATMPPLFLASTADDPCSNPKDIASFASLVRNHSNKTFFHQRYASGGHGWDTCEYYPHMMGKEVCGWRDVAAKWLKDAVQPYSACFGCDEKKVGGKKVGPSPWSPP